MACSSKTTEKLATENTLSTQVESTTRIKPIELNRATIELANIDLSTVESTTEPTVGETNSNPIKKTSKQVTFAELEPDPGSDEDSEEEQLSTMDQVIWLHLLINVFLSPSCLLCTFGCNPCLLDKNNHLLQLLLSASNC